MSYSKERAKYLRKKRKVQRILFVIFLFFLCGLCVFSSFYPAASWKYYFACPKVEVRKAGEMRVHFLSVGQGDCTLVEFPDGKTMLIDGGSPYGNSVNKVMRYLNALKIDELDYVVATGTQSERCGALVEVAKFKKIGFAYLPKTTSVGSLEYSNFCAELGRNSTPSTKAERYLRVESQSSEKYSFTFLLPNLEVSDGNSVLWIEWLGYGVLLFGNINSETETQLHSDAKLGYFDDLGIDLAKNTYLVRMENYGAATQATKSFYDYHRPQAVVISCLESVSFKPDEWAVEGANERYRTDLNGVVVATITSGGLSVKTEK